MREILFRGKHGEEWVYGSLIFKGEQPFIVAPSEPWYPVIPGTVGQYTGQIDIDVENVFEGDIIKRKDDGEFYIVSWDNDNARFILESRTEMIGFDDAYWIFSVVGNLFDNPDMADW